MAGVSRCKGCSADVLFRLTPAGKIMILDAAPTEERGQGVYVVINGKQCEPYAPMLHSEQELRYMAHWATCPMSSSFKSGGKA